MATAVLAACALFLASRSPGAAVQVETRPREPVIGLPCEGCEAVFEGLPAALSSSARIAPPNEPGQAMRIVGTVFDSTGQAASGVIVYAYHTSARGIYPTDGGIRGQAAARHGRLRGWAKTDEKGRYRFDTIRPAGYPDTDLPAHVHMHVIEVGRSTYYIDDILFEDDERLTPEKRSQLITGRGGNGLVVPRQVARGTWVVKRDIQLGAQIPGYPKDARQPVADGTRR